MSVINRLEIANFLNLDQVLPHQQGWRTHYPHLLLNFRGQSTAVVATNGIGKSTINRAVYALLTRDHEFARLTKSVTAPKRSGVFTHVRLEVLYRDRPVRALAGEMGADIPGEPYVIGFYGNADTELVFYSYQGHLEDCACAHQSGTKIHIEANQTFRARLKNQRECRHNPPRDEWREFIGKHFELAMLAQMVAYQKAGGGDSAEEFFKVKQRRIDGQTDEYDASFFYEHIAPEVLSNAMRGFGKEGETHFEDTILESASPLIRAELRNEKLAATLERDRTTFAALEVVQSNLREFVSARKRLDDEVAALAGEVELLFDAVEQRPLPGIPPVLKERAEGTRRVANRLVLQDGSWLVPAGTLAEIWGADPRTVSQEADRRGLSGIILRRREVIEIPCDSFISVSERGPPARAYSLDDAVLLTEGRTTFSSGWTKDEALRALRYGVEYRVAQGDTNPFRRAALALRQEQSQAVAARDFERGIRAELKEQHDDVVGRIGSLRADEHELSLIRQSGLFTGDEIDDLETTAASVTHELSRSRLQREEHERQRERLADARQAHGEYKVEFPDAPSPGRILEDLNADREAALAAAEAARQASEAAADEVRAAEDTRRRTERELSNGQEEHFRLKALVEPVERFEAAFPGEDPVGLAEQVQDEYDSANNRLATIGHYESAMGTERAGLFKLVPSYQECRSLFASEALEGLEAQVVLALRTARGRCSVLQAEAIPAAIDHRNELLDGHSAIAEVQATAGENPVGLEIRLRERHSLALGEIQNIRPALAIATTDAAAIASFGSEFGHQAEPHAVRRQRQDEAERVAARMSAAMDRRGDLERQLDELSRAATAAGRIANEVLEKVGKEALRVHQVVEREMERSPRRSAILTHFSHVLHAPVARDEEDAWMMLTALDEAGIEAPVFWLEGLREFCHSGVVTTSAYVSVGTLAGQLTLQVQGLIDPTMVERTRERVGESLTLVQQIIAELERTRADLDLASDKSMIVTRACDAIDRNVFSQLTELQSRAADLQATIERIDPLLAEPFVALMRTAEGFLATGGEPALSEATIRLDVLQTELAGYLEGLPRLEERASPATIKLIRDALRFEQAGGRSRLDDIDRELETLIAERNALQRRLPQLALRRDAIPDVRAAAEFAIQGGRAALQTQLERLACLQEAYDQAVRASVKALECLTERGSAAHAADARLTAATDRVGKWWHVLSAAKRYLENGGLAFDATYAEALERLQTDEQHQQRRSEFRFQMAAKARKAECEGLGAAALDRQRVGLAAALDEKDRQIATLERAIAEFEDRKGLAEANARRMDKAVVSLLESWKQARQAIADIEISAQALAATSPSEVIDAARATINALRSRGAEADDGLVQNVEELDGDIRRFALSSRIPTIKDARDRKDKAWTTYVKGVDALRTNKRLSLSDTDRALLADALTLAAVRHVDEIFTAFEQHLSRQTSLYEQAKQDIEDQRTKLSESLEAFTLNVADNFRLLRSCLKPSSDTTDAGFEIEADVIERHGIRTAVDKVIALIKMQEEQRNERVARQADAESQKEYERRIKEEIRRIFYRAVFIGSAKEPGSSPRVFLRHPRIGGGRKLRMDRRVSTGQANALALLLLTKLADYAISRDERALLATAGRRRGIIHSTRVVMIDGLFSNVSDRRLIRQSLDVMRTLKGRFQLIGWIHNEAYENDPEIFPEYLGIRRISDGEGFVIAEDIAAAVQAGELVNDTLELGPGTVSVLEMHADALPARAQP